MLLAARADIARGREPNSVRVGKGERPAKASPANETEGFRRRGSVGFVANLFLAGGRLSDGSLRLRAVENLHPPHHDDDSRHQRGCRQYTF